MDILHLINLEPTARHLKLPLASVRRAAELLEEGNTVPFITRYRKDQTGGLDEQQIRAIQKEINRVRMLVERKQAILKSIESRGQLTDDLAQQIDQARTIRLLEDIYLPYKPKKQTLAGAARARGLEPLAEEILAAKPGAPDLPRRAAEFASEEKGLVDAAAVLEGVLHLIAERFANDPKIRSQLRSHLWRHGKLTCKKTDEPHEEDASSDAKTAASDAKSSDAKSSDAKTSDAKTTDAKTTDAKTTDAEPSGSETDAGPSVSPTEQPGPSDHPPLPVETPSAPPDQQAASEASSAEADPSATSGPPAQQASPEEGAARVADADAASILDAEVAPGDAQTAGKTEVDAAAGEAVAENKAEAGADAGGPPSTSEVSRPAASPQAASNGTDEQELEREDQHARETAEGRAANAENHGPPAATESPKTKKTAKPRSKQAPPVSRRDKRREARRRRRERLVQSFKDYFDFSEPIRRIPHHRVLAINRGERTKVLRVKLECPDLAEFQTKAEEKFIAAEHPFRDFLRRCLQDAISRLVLPSLEREVRRELNEKAEEHAVGVFARNLRKLLLQPPLHHHRVVAIDPGFRNGCKLVALDEFGKVLGHTFIHLVGKDPRQRAARRGLVAFAREHRATVIAIGNGTACRETEALVAEVLGEELKDRDVSYLIVNEAGASVYSTSEIGREELPDHDATVRRAVSIGRRSLDPLSELVKIDPASIGVGLYQHDVKAKHLRESLDAVVESCVNYVGVDVNSASPALLRYVSGLNALTARRIFEHRQSRGPFRRREQLKEVSGIGESTFVQAAGFLKLKDGDNPLDGTWIHPESYPIARRVLQAIGFDSSDLYVNGHRAEPSKEPAAGRQAVPTESGSTATASSPATEPDGQSIADPATDHTQGPAAEDAGSMDGTSDATAEGNATLENAPHASAAPEKAIDDAGDAAPTYPGESVGLEPAAAAPPPRQESTTAEQGTADQHTAGSAIATQIGTETTAKPEAPEPADPPPAPDAAAITASDHHGGAPTETADVDGSAVTDARTAPRTDNGAAATTDPETPQLSVRVDRMKRLREKLAEVNVDELAAELDVGKLLLRDILQALSRPGRDPREDLPPPIFRRGILKLEDLRPEMELSGTVLNVVDFGAFVDIGLVDSGLIHVSRLADQYVSDPHDVVSVGDILRVWVVDVDQKRRRVSLTAIEPGTQRRTRKERHKPSRDEKSKRPRKTPSSEAKKPARGKGGKPTRHHKPKSKPKPVVPITKEMEEGKEPLRTFGDLKQLFDKRLRGND